MGLPILESPQGACGKPVRFFGERFLGGAVLATLAPDQRARS